MPAKKITVGGVKLCCVESGGAAEVLRQQLQCPRELGESGAVCFLSFNSWLLRLVSPRVRRVFSEMPFVCPGSSLTRWACRQLIPGKPKPLNPFQFVVETLIELNNREGSVFLLGDTRQNLESAETALLRSFPHLRILGRYHGRGVAYRSERVAEAVKKCAPDVLLVGCGRFYWSGLHAQARLGWCIYHRPIIRLFARYGGAHKKRLNFLRRNSSPLAFLLPWTWLKLPFALGFVCYVFILKLRKSHD